MIQNNCQLHMWHCVCPECIIAYSIPPSCDSYKTKTTILVVKWFLCLGPQSIYLPAHFHPFVLGLWSDFSILVLKYLLFSSTFSDSSFGRKPGWGAQVRPPSVPSRDCSTFPPQKLRLRTWSTWEVAECRIWQPAISPLLFASAPTQMEARLQRQSIQGVPRRP